MKLTREVVDERAAEYADREPLYVVEQEAIETLGDALAAGEYGWRDVEWIVRWYYRRSLGAIPDAERRVAEERFRQNEFGVVREAIEGVCAASDDDSRIERLTALSGVDVPGASAFLLFFDPDRYAVVGRREWTVLWEAGELSDPYPDPLPTTSYEEYLGCCRALGDRFDCDMWTLYRALWRLGAAK